MYCVLCIVVIRNTYCVLCIVYCVIPVIRNTVIRNTACAYVRSNITVRVYVCACCITTRVLYYRARTCTCVKRLAYRSAKTSSSISEIDSTTSDAEGFGRL